jgi:fused signal recognition particle receptor
MPLAPLIHTIIFFISISLLIKLPITYIGLGEKMEDLRPFNGEDFAKALLLS